jgi:hypothetical protein
MNNFVEGSPVIPRASMPKLMLVSKSSYYNSQKITETTLVVVSERVHC